MRASKLMYLSFPGAECDTVPRRTLRDNLSLQCLDFMVASYSVNFSPEASEGSGHKHDEIVRTLTQCNGIFLRPASDYGLYVLDASTGLIGRGVRVWGPRTAVLPEGKSCRKESHMHARQSRE